MFVLPGGFYRDPDESGENINDQTKIKIGLSIFTEGLQMNKSTKSSFEIINE